jgi:Na+-translocating ferredoxin:NAD+ oxidoreductase RnfC subunit
MDGFVEPEEVHVLRSQHVGAPATSVVSVGAHVEEGDLIGDIPEGSLGAPIHASISGTITEITNEFISIRRN